MVGPVTDAMPAGTGPRRRSAHTGRRPGASGTRDAIFGAAQRQFAGQGFERTSIRSIAVEAGVDPALVTHYFGSKQRLFAAVVELPFDPGQVIAQVLDGERAEVGRRLGAFLARMLSTPAVVDRMTGLVRAAATDDEAAARVRTLITEQLLTPLAAALGGEDARLRGALAGSQVVGFLMARHVVGIPPLGELDADRIVALLAPTLQRYLVDDLG